MFENLKILKSISWKDLVVTVAFGIIIATGINYGVGYVRSIEEKANINEQALDKSVIKAFRVNSHNYKDGYLFIEMDAIKIRDCGRPTQFYIKYKNENDTYVAVDEVQPMNALKTDGSFSAPNILPVVDEWQRVGFWRVKPPIEKTEFFVYLEHNCPVLLTDDTAEKLVSSDYQQVAQETISRTYGPFELR